MSGMMLKESGLSAQFRRPNDFGELYSIKLPLTGQIP